LLKNYKGHLLAFLGIVFWGIAGPVAKFLYYKGFSSFLIIQTRSTFSFILLFLIFIVFRRDLIVIPLKDALKLMLLGVIGLAGPNFFYYTSIKYVTVATGIMIQYTTPFMVMIYSILMKQEKYHHLKLFFLSIAFIACFFTISGGDINYFTTNVLGVTLAIAAALTWAFYNIYHKYIQKKYNSWTELFYILLGATLLWIIINPNLFVELSSFSFQSNMILFFFAMLSVLIPLTFYNIGLRNLKATQATSIGLLEPVMVVVFAYIFVNETMSLIQIISGIIVLLSIYLLESYRQKIDYIEKK